ncbi:MAG TPA: hypothetical protein VMV49_17350 [Candidatus Deferrimicrobium sp.]|nr:hypothetical protein [Candidatus Deferrimicrobium sp.]
MAQKKTVFERLEDKMVELEQNIDNKLMNLQSSLQNLKEDIPKSIGQSLMSFADMIGAKIENIEDALQNIGPSRGAAPDLSAIKTLQNDLTEIKNTMKTLQNAIANIKVEIPPTTVSPSIPAKVAPATVSPPQPAAPASTKPPTVTQSSPISVPKEPISAIPTSAPSPSPSAPVEGPISDVINLLDEIKTKAKSGITAVQLANEMEQTRDTIVKIFRWHPALYELATFARRLKKYPEAAGLDTEILELLLEKVEEWKNRVSS